MDQLAPRTISLRLMVRVTHNVTIVTSWAAKDFTRDCVHSLVGRAQWRKSHQGRVACENERRTSSGIEEVSSYHCHKVLEESLSSRETWVAEFSVLESFLQKINERICCVCCEKQTQQIHSFVLWENLQRGNLLSVLSDL